MLLGIHCPGSNAEEDKAEIRRRFCADSDVVDISDRMALRDALEVYDKSNPQQNLKRLGFGLTQDASDCPRYRKEDHTCETFVPENEFPAGSLFVVRHRTCRIGEHIRNALQEARDDEELD